MSQIIKTIKGEININKYITAILLIAIMMAPVSAKEVEIRSEIATGNMVYDFQNAPFLWMDLDKNISSEVITIVTSGADNRTIAEGALTYVCKPESQDYKNPDINDTYNIIGFLGNNFVVYDAANELVKLLENWDSDDKAILQTGESYLMPEGYELRAREIDLDGSKVAVSLLKDGKTIDEEIVQNGGSYIYEDSDDVMIFAVMVDSVFRGTDSNFCQIKYVWLISQDVLKVTTSDSFGELEVTGTNPITLSNDGTITLGADDEIDLTDNLVIRVADNDTALLYYIAKIIEFPVCEVCEACPEPEPCPEIEPCPECPEVNVTMNETGMVVKEIDTPLPVEEPVKTSSLPWGNIILASIGLIVILYLVLNQKGDGKAITAD